MLNIYDMRLNYAPWKGDGRLCVSETKKPVFSWKYETNSSYCDLLYDISFSINNNVFFKSSDKEITDTVYFYDGDELPVETPIEVKLKIKNIKTGEDSSIIKTFYISGLSQTDCKWISVSKYDAQRVYDFNKFFKLKKPFKCAVLYVCGLGYHSIRINGEKVDYAKLDPSFSNYSKSVYYVMLPKVEQYLKSGINNIDICLGSGWRNNSGSFTNEEAQKNITFFGPMQLMTLLKVKYFDGTEAIISSDLSWKVQTNPICYSHLFNGETYNATENIQNLETIIVPKPGGIMRLMTSEPIKQREVYDPIAIFRKDEKRFIVDFGQNLSGVCKVRLPATMSKKQKIVLRHAEELDDLGELYTVTLRNALATDTYIASGNLKDLNVWQPEFVYHGFRYVEITGLDYINKEDINAVSIYNDVSQVGFFKCGSSILNEIHNMILCTERYNLHSIFTDCPQRDERLGWLNDTTVRFEEAVFNYDIESMLAKFVQDVIDEQGYDGAITCTAPFVYGNRPADPVSSSFLVAGWLSYLHYGNIELIKHSYLNYKKWVEFLKKISDNNIINLSYYGDWSAPVYACVGGEKSIDAVHSAFTPGEFMSTCFYYYDTVLMERFADILQIEADREYFSVLKESIKEAILKKWWNDEESIMATGSQGCQSMAIWLDLIPESKKAKVAEIIHYDLIERKYCITTGNLCTRYMLDALSQNGYIDDAYILMTRDKYPSLGYMIQNGATTVWERFEQKLSGVMNSHNHPMYGSVDYWFYTYILGIKVVSMACNKIIINPCFPLELQYAEGHYSTVKGTIHVGWNKRYGKLNLYVTVPSGITADVFFDGQKKTITNTTARFQKGENI